MSDSLRRIKEHWIEEHKWIEENIIRYIDSVIPVYKENFEKYREKIDKFLLNLEAHVTHHHKFEEMDVFPYLSGHQLIENIEREHREIENFISSLKHKSDLTIDDLEVLRNMINIHLAKENTHVISLLDI
jgi:predicted RecB family endonuclease